MHNETVTEPKNLMLEPPPECVPDTSPIRSRSPFRPGTTTPGGVRALLRRDLTDARINSPKWDVGAVEHRLDPARLVRPVSCLHGLSIVAGAMLAQVRTAQRKVNANARCRSEHVAMSRAAIASLLPEAEQVRDSVLRAIRLVLGMFPETMERVPTRRSHEIREIVSPLLDRVTSLHVALVEARKHPERLDPCDCVPPAAPAAVPEVPAKAPAAPDVPAAPGPTGPGPTPTPPPQPTIPPSGSPETRTV